MIFCFQDSQVWRSPVGQSLGEIFNKFSIKMDLPVRIFLFSNKGGGGRGQIFSIKRKKVGKIGSCFKKEGYYLFSY